MMMLLYADWRNYKAGELVLASVAECEEILSSHVGTVFFGGYVGSFSETEAYRIESAALKSQI